MKKILLFVIVAIVAGCKSSSKFDRMSPYWYDPHQTEVTFSEKGDTLYRFPRVNKGGDYVIPSTVKHIFERAFENCQELRSVEIPASVEDIEMAAFDLNYKLEKVVFKNQLKNIPFRCFMGCLNLKEIHLANAIPPEIEVYEETDLENIIFFFDDNNLKDCTIYVPKGSKELYKNAYCWRLFEKIVEE